MFRTTPELITRLHTDEIFVFGSNLAGRHGRGAAKTAMEFGAIYGQANGLQGNTYAIPTVNERITDKLPLDTIKLYIDEFVEFSISNPTLIFFVTKIGCGLAGYQIQDIAPLFRETINIDNIYLPEEFWRILNGNN